MSSNSPHSMASSPVDREGGARETWKSPTAWRGIDRRPDYVLAELADVEVEYRLADSDTQGAAAVWTRCPNCHAPAPAQANICPECGYHRRFGRRIAPLTRASTAPQNSLTASWLSLVEWIARRVFPRHRALCVRDRTFNDADLLRLKRLSRYRSLDFEGTQITDGVVELLARLRRLQFLIVRGTRISNEGVRRLREKLPRCEVID